MGYIETYITVKPLNRIMCGIGILIVKDNQDRKEIPGQLGMKVIRECRELFLQEFGPTFTCHTENREATQNCIKAFEMSSHSEVKGFARVAGREDVCIPANSMSVVRVVGPLQDVCGLQGKSVCIEPLATRQDDILINSVSSASKSSVYHVQVPNLGDKTSGLKLTVGLALSVSV